MITATIHYTSPANDSFKVPRPHRFTLDGSVSDHSPLCVGGEIGEVRLLGFCPTVTPDPDNWTMTHPNEVADPGFAPAELAGMYAQFVSVADGGMFGYDIPIEQVEVSIQ